MPSHRELLERLKAADRSLSKERMPRASARRVAKRISKELESQSRPARMGWIPMLTFVAGAVLVLLFLRWGTDDATPFNPHESDVPVMKVSVSGSDCRAQSDGSTRVWGACSISTDGPSMRVDTIEDSHLEVRDRVVHLRSGSALFDVDPVQGEPIRVAVPQGEIVVVGTRFRVVVSEERSEVELYEGRLEFHDASGTTTPILAGQLVSFGEAPPTEALPTEALPTEALPTEALPTEALPTEALPTEALPTEALPTEALPTEARALKPTDSSKARRGSAPRRAVKSAPDSPSVEDGAGPVIEAAERLRREGRYAEAAETLRTALKRRWPTRTAEVLSYELGRLLQRRIRDQTSACSHWRTHLERFATTRYRARIERAMNDLGCESP